MSVQVAEEMTEVVVNISLGSDVQELRGNVTDCIVNHERAAAYCTAYNNLAAWSHTLTAAVSVALSAALAAKQHNNELNIALIVLTAATTVISFWQTSCRFASRATAHEVAVAR